MPKISSNWIDKGYASEKSTKKNNNMKTKDVFVRPKVGQTIRGRIIGGHVDVISHWPRIDDGSRKENGEIDWKNESFPDEEERNFKPTRVCCDDTPAKERFQDMEGYLANTTCPWCKLKYQGYHGNVRHAFNIIIHPDNICRILEIPPTAMGMLSKICADCIDLMPGGDPGSISGKVFEFVFSRPQLNQWVIERYPNLSLDDPSIGNYLVDLTENDKAALRVINPDADTEEELLKGHDLDRWYHKDYLSAEWQRKLEKQLGLKPKQYLSLSAYDLDKINSSKTEEEPSESEEQKEPENVNNASEEDEWGEVEDNSSDTSEENSSTDEAEISNDNDVTDDYDDDDDDEEPLW